MVHAGIALLAAGLLLVSTLASPSFEVRLAQALDRLAQDTAVGAPTAAWAKARIIIKEGPTDGYHWNTRTATIDTKAVGWEFDWALWHEIWHAVQFEHCPPVFTEKLRDPWLHHQSAIMDNYMSKTLRWDDTRYPHWFWQQDYFGALVESSGMRWDWSICQLGTVGTE